MIGEVYISLYREQKTGYDKNPKQLTQDLENGSSLSIFEYSVTPYIINDFKSEKYIIGKSG